MNIQNQNAVYHVPIDTRIFSEFQRRKASIRNAGAASPSEFVSVACFKMPPRPADELVAYHRALYRGLNHQTYGDKMDIAD